MSGDRLDSDFGEILALTINIGQALNDHDPEKAVRLTHDRQILMNEIDRKRQTGAVLTRENSRQLAEIAAADQPLLDAGQELFEQYREALAATRKFRQVKAYLDRSGESSQYLDLTE